MIVYPFVSVYFLTYLTIYVLNQRLVMLGMSRTSDYHLEFENKGRYELFLMD